MLASILSKISLPVLLNTVGKVLGGMKNPVARGAAEALEKVEWAVQNGDITIDEVREANRHIETMTELESAEAQNTITQVNESLRAEVASADPYVRRMRPTFGYIMAITWAAQMLSVAYTILEEPDNAPHIIDAMASLSTIWTVGLSVLGIYVYKRSQEKLRG